MCARSSMRWLAAGLLAAALNLAPLAAPLIDRDGERATAQEGPYLALDMDVTNGSAPCDPAYIDASAVRSFGESYKVAVCIAGLEGSPVWSFYIAILYDDTLNYAPEIECADPPDCLDDNPDASGGATKWGDGLGPSLLCNEPIGDEEPLVGPGKGRAYIQCGVVDPPATLGDDETWGVLAIVNFQAIHAGTDTMEFAAVDQVWDRDSNELAHCSDVPRRCYGGTEANFGGPVGGIAEAPPPEAETLANGRHSSAPNALTLVRFATATALLLVTGGWYARRRWRAV